MLENDNDPVRKKTKKAKQNMWKWWCELKVFSSELIDSLTLIPLKNSCDNNNSVLYYTLK